MSILVTGGAGYIGSHTCIELIKNGYGDKIRVDFSVINDMSYYNGFVFKGFYNPCG